MVHRMKTKESKEGEPPSTEPVPDAKTEEKESSSGTVALTLGVCIVVAWVGEVLGEALPGQQVIMMITVEFHYKA